MKELQYLIYKLITVVTALMLFISSPIFGYQWPISPFNSQHQINSTLGEYRITYLHEGVDIHATQGTAVYPVEDGTVIGIGSNWVKVEDDWGYTYTYVHLTSIPYFIPYESYVFAGYDKLGVTDSYNHLHFEDGDGDYNPLDYLYPFTDNGSPVVDSIQLVKNITEETYPIINGLLTIFGNIDIKGTARDGRVASDGSGIFQVDSKKVGTVVMVS